MLLKLEESMLLTWCVIITYNVYSLEKSFLLLPLSEQYIVYIIVVIVYACVEYIVVAYIILLPISHVFLAVVQ